MFGLALALATFAPEGGLPPMDLWPKGNPGGWTRDDKEVTETTDFRLIKNISHPTLEFFPAKNAEKGAPTVLVCPGGGYWIVAIDHEGYEIAKRLNEAGIHAAVLKYRLPVEGRDKVRHLPALQDAQRAMRMLRAGAKGYGIDPDKIGIMGFSAGGHLSAVASTELKAQYEATDDVDKQPFRPNFTVLVYPAYLADEGPLVVPVDKTTPPAFLVSTMDDHIPMEGSLAYATALKKAGVPAEVHVYPKGGHGYGLRSKEPGIMGWPELMIAWVLRTA
jgi:acetyl esterase/lipase